MPNSLIPALDPAPLPGPPWLFHILWVVTFLIHLVFVNAVLGGSLLSALVGTRRPGGREAQALFAEVNGWAISFAVTFGIAPLLFMQVLFGRFFYTATILIAWAWLGMLVLLTAGYYLNYLAKFRLKAGREAGGILILEAICFLAVAAIQVAVNLLHLQPGRWESVAGQAWSALRDPAFLPRYLHFVLAAATMSALLLAFVAVRRAAHGGDQEACQGMARFGIRAATIATGLQITDGFWLLFALPENVLRAFMRGGATTMLPLTLGLLAGIFLLVLLAQISNPLGQAGKVRRAAELLGGAMVVMVVTRHQLRGLYLAPSRVGEQAVVRTQGDVLAIFLVVFLACVGLTVYAFVRALKDRPGPGEPAA